jgi:excinuclease ABC subunit A
MSQHIFSPIDINKYIFIKGARMHNLKNIDVQIPKNKLVVITGLSGSGKSSLAFDTLYAEGQRRYVESLSSYARQFLGRMNKPDVDYIKGIAPAIAIEQKVNTTNTRSTVGTSTEIYDYLKLLFARVGETYSPISNQKVVRDTVSSVTEQLLKLPNDTVLFITYEFVLDKKRGIEKELELLQQKGFIRVLHQGKVERIDALLEQDVKKLKASDVQVLVDRVIISQDNDELNSRIADSVSTAFFEGHGKCTIYIQEEQGLKSLEYSDKFELDGIHFEEPNPNFFSFNNPYGACKTCEGFGKVIGIDEDLVIPDKTRSVFDSAIAPWRGDKMQEYTERLIEKAHLFDFPIHKAIKDLSPAHYQLLWDGNQYFMGLTDFFKYLEEQTYKIQYRVMLSRYRGRTTCPDCKGTRLRKDASYVKIAGKSIIDLVLMPVDELLEFFKMVELSPYHATIAQRLLVEVNNRLQFLNDVGLGYLTLNRLSATLSGGESQRINLATTLGSSLVGSIYVLDEPSIGLHSKDTQKLIGVLKSLRDAGNTVVVVEHDEEVIREADYIIDIGPLAGTGGGNLIHQGDFAALLNNTDSYTAKYLTNQLRVEFPNKRRAWNKTIQVKGASENNLQSIDVAFPLECLTVVTGVSGSGKTSLVKRILVPAIQKLIGEYNHEQTGKFAAIEGDIQSIHSIEMVDQNPIGRSSKSNPATYVKAYDEIRSLFASLPQSKANNVKPGSFSFNMEGGRCETCQGEGTQKIEMQFMADINLECEECKGKRFKPEILEITYKQKNIYDVLCLTIDEALDFFKDEKKIAQRLQPLQDVGLGYVQLGQSSSTLSGGEAQRIKLASFLQKSNDAKHTLFVFDEPTTGLHFHDISKLMKSINALIEKGNSVIIIEHNMDVIQCADWIIDIGPEGGKHGGTVVFEGTPEQMISGSSSHTSQFLRQKLSLIS